MSKLIYISKKPKFSIRTDCRQWILQTTFRTFHPTFSLLLDELAEQMFRNMPNKVKELKELDASISKVYALIDKVTKDIKDEPWNQKK